MSRLVIALGGRVSVQPTTRRPPFRRGVTALHTFEYEDANEAFGQARRLDPGLVMAYWGEAMTYHQTLWRNENVQAARAALARLGPTPAARRARTAPKGAGVSRRGGIAVRGGRRVGAPAPLRGRDGPALRAVSGRSGRRVVLRAGAARHDVAQPDRLRRRARRPQPGARRQRDAGAGRGDPRPRAARASRASGRAALPAAQRRRPAARAPGARRRAHARAARTRLEPRAAHAGAHLPAARTVARRDGVGPLRVRGIRRMGRAQASRAGDAQLPRARRGCSTSCCSSDATARRGRRSIRSRRSSRRAAT